MGPHFTNRAIESVSEGYAVHMVNRERNTVLRGGMPSKADLMTCPVPEGYVQNAAKKLLDTTEILVFRHEMFLLNSFNYNTFVFVVCTAILLFSYFSLLQSKRPVEAIFSFLIYLLTLLFPFFIFDADYIGSIHLLVYPGAILIFFAFATLTTDQKGFWSQWYLAEKRYSSGYFGIIFTALFLVATWFKLLANAYSGGVSVIVDLNRSVPN